MGPDGPLPLHEHYMYPSGTTVTEPELDLPENKSSGSLGKDINAWCFATAQGRVIFGVNLRETLDSHYIAFPAMLFGDEDGIHGKSLVAAPVVRVYKPSLLYSCPVPEDQGYFYYRFLYSKVKSNPDFFSEDQVRFLKDTLDAPSPGSKTAEAMVTRGRTPSSSGVEEEDDDTEDPVGSWRKSLYSKTTRH